jgi:hypothetical protein
MLSLPSALILWLEAIEDMARRLRMDALGREQILDAERNALERPTRACRQPRIRGLRHVPRVLGRHRDIGVELGIGRLDRGQVGLGQLDGGKLLRFEPPARRGEAEVGEFGGQSVSFDGFGAS